MGRYHLMKPAKACNPDCPLFCIISSGEYRGRFRAKWAAFRPNWLRQKWLNSLVPHARSHRPSRQGVRGASSGLASYKLSFLLRPTSPLYAICGAAGARTRRVNEARNFGPTQSGEPLGGCFLCQDGLSFTILLLTMDFKADFNFDHFQRTLSLIEVQ